MRDQVARSSVIMSFHPSETTDPNLIESIKDWRDDEGWRRFHERYASLILKHAKSCGLTPLEAEEALQETMIKVSLYIPRFDYNRDRCRFRVWLNTVVNHRISDAMRRRRSQVRESMMLECLMLEMDLEGISGGNDGHPTPAQFVLLEMVINQVRSRSSPAGWQLFEARFLHGLSTKEIAHQFQTTQVNVRVSQYRILMKLRRAWRELGEGPIPSNTEDDA